MKKRKKSIEKDYTPPQDFLEVKEKEISKREFLKRERLRREKEKKEQKIEEEITQAIEKLSKEELQRLKEAARKEAERDSSLTPGNQFYEVGIRAQTEAILRSKVRERLNPG